MVSERYRKSLRQLLWLSGYEQPGLRFSCGKTLQFSSLLPPPQRWADLRDGWVWVMGEFGKRTWDPRAQPPSPPRRGCGLSPSHRWLSRGGLAPDLQDCLLQGGEVNSRVHYGKSHLATRPKATLFHPTWTDTVFWSPGTRFFSCSATSELDTHKLHQKFQEQTPYQQVQFWRYLARNEYVQLVEYDSFIIVLRENLTAASYARHITVWSCNSISRDQTGFIFHGNPLNDELW